MMKINKCIQCGRDYMHSDSDERFKKLCQDCVKKNEQAERVKNKREKRNKIKTKHQVYEKQRQCAECSFWFYPKNIFQQVCDEDCRTVRRLRLRKIHIKQRKKSPAEQLRVYKAVTKGVLDKLDEEHLFKRANQAVIRLELIDDILTKKFGTTLDLLSKKAEGK